MYNLSNQSASCLFREHLLSRLFEIRATLIIKLLFCVCRSSLRLCVLQGLRILVLVRSWSLLHPHHCPSISALACVVSYGAHTRVHSRVHSLRSSSCNSTLTRHNRRLSSVCLNLWLFPYDVEHTILQGFLVFAQAILFPSIIH